MGQLPILTELVVSIVGGVLTAIILSMFARRGNSSASTPATNLPADAENGRRGGGGASAAASFLRMIVAVCGGIFVALFVGRILIQAGILPRDIGGRLVLLVLATAIIWLVLPFGRSRR